VRCSSPATAAGELRELRDEATDAARVRLVFRIGGAQQALFETGLEVQGYRQADQGQDVPDGSRQNDQPEREDEQPQIDRVANDGVEPGGLKCPGRERNRMNGQALTEVDERDAQDSEADDREGDPGKPHQTIRRPERARGREHQRGKKGELNRHIQVAARIVIHDYSLPADWLDCETTKARTEVRAPVRNC
jgi:hypothetical protein